MGLTGLIFGALLGLYFLRTLWGAVLGALAGYVLEQAASGRARAAPEAASVSSEFFRTTFEFMGHVAKSDGRVSEAEIDAARRVMRELLLGPLEVSMAIECFRTGKFAGYDWAAAIDRLRAACGLRHHLLRAFMELQLRAALAGNGLSASSRSILQAAAERLGFSGLEFAYMEAAARARQGRAAGGAGSAGGANGTSGSTKSNRAPSIADCYAELEIEASAADQEVKKAYRRQMSRHHPDKLVANGLPESMAQMAKEKTQRIQEAYETIRAARGMR